MSAIVLDIIQVDALSGDKDAGVAAKAAHEESARERERKRANDNDASLVPTTTTILRGSAGAQHKGVFQ